MTQLWRHHKRGTIYELIGEATLQMSTSPVKDNSTMVVYRGPDGLLWVRDKDEFYDGRFGLVGVYPIEHLSEAEAAQVEKICDVLYGSRGRDRAVALRALRALSLPAFLAREHQPGAEDMRERAARTAEDWNYGTTAARRIRALPLEPAAPDLCEDEGCEHHGTPHVCIVKEHQAAAEDVVDAARYRRLRILGCAPGNTQELDQGLVLRFTNLDAFIDDDIRAHPSRGEAATAIRTLPPEPQS